MTEAADLERAYRRWLRWYPKAFRREHEAEILDVLVAGAREGQRAPGPMECLDLMSSAMLMRLRAHVPRSDRAGRATVRLMYLCAVLDLAVAFTIAATVGEVRAHVVELNPGLTDTEWQAIVSGQLEPKALAAGVAVGCWLWMAWASGRGHRWPRIALVIVFGINTVSLFDGLVGGSAVYARTDLVIGLVFWSVELAVLALLLHVIAGSRSGAGRTSPQS
jgi:hypothetical protein